jgi:hypothetical protein
MVAIKRDYKQEEKPEKSRRACGQQIASRKPRQASATEKAWTAETDIVPSSGCR